MQNYAFQIFIFCLFLSSVGCVIAPDYPDEPVLTYNGISKNTIVQGVSNTDSFYISANFTDGDGDLGNEDENKFNLFLIDTASAKGKTLRYFSQNEKLNFLAVSPINSIFLIIPSCNNPLLSNSLKLIPIT